MMESPDRDDVLGPDDHARIFHEAQRSADTIFSHYQLSQLLATHAMPASMAQAVLDELVHVCDAEGGAIWLAQSSDEPAEVIAQAGPAEPPVLPVAADPSWVTVELEDVGVVGLATSAARPIDEAARRFLALIRHEVAIALRGALLRQTLERERAELAAVIHGASDAIVLVDADRRVTRLNPAAERMLRRSVEAVLGETCDRALACGGGTPRERACGRACPFARVLTGAEAIDGAERTLVAATGDSTSVVGSYALTSRSGDGRPQAVGILRDTTELARLAELRRGFLGSVSHELRTPLALIKGYVETLLHLDPDPETARAYLRRIDQTTNRLSAIVGQILDASQLAADHLDLDVEVVDVRALIAEALDGLALRQPRLDVLAELSDELPPLTVDRDRVRQVLDNLLENAAKYGNGAIALRASVDRDWLTIRIEDGGVGIPDDERELVFEQFHRARNVRGGRVPGSGLGLAITRRVVEAHGGSVAFDPDRRDGTAVEVRLPLEGRRMTPLPVGAVEVRQ